MEEKFCQEDILISPGTAQICKELIENEIKKNAELNCYTKKYISKLRFAIRQLQGKYRPKDHKKEIVEILKTENKRG